MTGTITKKQIQNPSDFEAKNHEWWSHSLRGGGGGGVFDKSFLVNCIKKSAGVNKIHKHATYFLIWILTWAT